LRRARLWRDTFVDTRETAGGGRWVRRRAARRAAELAVRAVHAAPSGMDQPSTDALPLVVPAGQTAAADLTGRLQPTSSGVTDQLPRTGPAAPPAAAASPAPLVLPDVLAGQGATPSSRRNVSTVDADGPLVDQHAGPADPGINRSARSAATVYTPTGEEDTRMYQAWCRAVAAGREPSGVDLARAAGRANDATGIGRRAARRYRDAHTAARYAASHPVEAMPTSTETAAATAAFPVAAVAAAPDHRNATPRRHNGNTPMLTGAAP